MFKKFLILLIIIVAFIVGALLSPSMPDEMISHWNSKGEADGTMSKFWGLFLMPFVLLGLFLMFIFIPRIDPLKRNIAKFINYFDNFILVIIVFLFYLYLLTLFWNMNYRFNMIRALIPAFSLLFFYVGVLLEKSKRNWFIGVRTPWTLSNDKVWDKTNKLAGKIFKIVGTISLLGIIFVNYAIYILLIPLFFGAIYPIVYSYFEYQKLVKSNNIISKDF
jgi:uncharacterized membrane protein